MKHLVSLLPALSLLISFAIYWHRDDIAEYFNPPDKTIPIITVTENEEEPSPQNLNPVSVPEIPLHELRDSFLSSTEKNINLAIEKKFIDPSSVSDNLKQKNHIIQMTDKIPEKSLYWKTNTSVTALNTSMNLNLYFKIFQENSLGEDNSPTTSACWSLLITTGNKVLNSQFSCDGFREEANSYFAIEDNLQISDNPLLRIAVAVEVPAANSSQGKYYILVDEKEWIAHSTQWTNITKQDFDQASKQL